MANRVTRYDSLWDWSTWLVLAFVLAVFLLPIFFADDMSTRVVIVIIAVVLLTVTVALFNGIYYCIDGNRLLVYQFFHPTAFPIDKIERIVVVKCMLAASATTSINRVAIKFSDRSVLKSFAPLLISPKNQKDFIEHLISINSDIKTEVLTVNTH